MGGFRIFEETMEGLSTWNYSGPVRVRVLGNAVEALGGSIGGSHVHV